MERGRWVPGRTVVVGAGVVGASVAYHLARLGHDEVLVVDSRGRTEMPGSTGLAPGFVGRLSATPELTALAVDSVATYGSLVPDGGGDSPFREVGCLEVATSEGRLERAHRDVEHGRGLGVAARVVGPEEAVALAPALVDPQRACGALYVPGDGAVDPVLLTRLLVDAAERDGVRFRFKTPVVALEHAGDRVTGVRVGADGEVVAAERVVLAAGIWGPVLAAQVGVRLPMTAVRHPYLYTRELPEPADALGDGPIVRYPEHCVYTRRHGRRYGLGSYAHTPLPLTPTSSLTSAEVPFHEADFGTALAEATALVPAFRAAPLGRRLSGVFAMTPDELPLVGPAPGVAGLWCAEASWVTHAGGVGRQLAAMLLQVGELLVDPDRLAPGRFTSWSENRIHEAALAHYQGIYEAH
ncbi:FAD-binding oxidoreductase [Streptomyces sp. NA04227]|uniref:NAD(P)/FAD-dependent oxidoreductase n=1 Tax=Streptomyces sp. NA04227 TaxID=2742136 RepID=UPI00158FDB0E|nr:FAD-dependent oxidoreductase [Streptomyces sp. NA04227]QKW07741.1 FAD-binding oxidoreductase [Streptomyces sp. NA04227]